MNFVKKYLPHLVAAIFLLIPVFVFAESSVATIQNPLGAGNTSVEAVIQKIMSIVAVLGGIVVVFFIIYSGFKFVTAGDNEGDRTKAKDTFFATIIGAAILLGAGIIATIVVNTVNGLK